jgi:hypothetical protein
MWQVSIIGVDLLSSQFPYVLQRRGWWVVGVLEREGWWGCCRLQREECCRGRGAGGGGVVGVLQMEEVWGCCRGRGGESAGEGGVVGVLQRQREEWWECCSPRDSPTALAHSHLHLHMRPAAFEDAMYPSWSVCWGSRFALL